MAIVTRPATKEYRDNFDTIFGKRESHGCADGVPRRRCVDRMTPAELACLRAIDEIEKLTADVRLTRAQVLISEAQALVADFVDSRP